MAVRGQKQLAIDKLSKTQRKHLLTLHDAGEHTQAELAELFRVSDDGLPRAPTSVAGANYQERHLSAGGQD